MVHGPGDGGCGSGRVGFTIVVVLCLGLGRGRHDSTGKDETGRSSQKKKSHHGILRFLFFRFDNFEAPIRYERISITPPATKCSGAFR